MISWLKKRRKLAQAKARARFREKIAAKIKFMEDNPNQGLRYRTLCDLPEVRRVSTIVRAASCRVEVEMYDGFTLSASDFWENEAMLFAARKVANRLMEGDH